MNKLFQILFLTALITSLLCGCKLPADRIAFNSIATVVEGARAADKGWAVYFVAQKKKLVGNETALIALYAKDKQVENAYTAYQKIANPIVLAAAAVAGTSLATTAPPPELVAAAESYQTTVNNLTK